MYWLLGGDIEHRCVPTQRRYLPFFCPPCVSLNFFHDVRTFFQLFFNYPESAPWIRAAGTLHCMRWKQRIGEFITPHRLTLYCGTHAHSPSPHLLSSCVVPGSDYTSLLYQLRQPWCKRAAIVYKIGTGCSIWTMQQPIVSPRFQYSMYSCDNAGGLALPAPATVRSWNITYSKRSQRDFEAV